MEHYFVHRKYVAYYQRQGASGLGLSEQRTSVNTYIKNRGEILAELTDIESGKKNNRPKLIKAIAYKTEFYLLPNSTVWLEMLLLFSHFVIPA